MSELEQESYETIASAADDQSTEPAAVEEDSASEVEAPTTEAVTSEEPPSWFQDFNERYSPVLEQMAQLFEPEQEQPQQVDYSQLDMTNPEHVAYLVQSQIETAMRDQMRPYEPLLGSVAEERGRQTADKYFDQLETDLGGEFDREHALVVYQAYASQPGADPVQALSQAARQTYEYEQSIRESAVAAYKEEQEKTMRDRLEGDTGQPPLGTAPADELDSFPTGADKYEILAKRFEDRQRASIPN